MKVSVPTRWLPALGTVLALLLLAGAVSYTGIQLRDELRKQLTRRDARLVEALLKQRLRGTEEDFPNDPLLALLETARLPELPGVVSLGLYDTNGIFLTALPSKALDTSLNGAQLSKLRGSDQPLTEYMSDAALANDFLLDTTPITGSPVTKVPMLEVILRVPAANGFEAGYARFLLDGSPLAQEFATLDATLTRQAELAFLLAGGAMTIALAVIFLRLTQIQRRLMAANRELTLAAKTSAVGAVTSHLLHGLKNPLAGLHQFVSAQGGSTAADSSTDWSGAADTTRRMRTMIDEVTRVLREESGLTSYEVAPDELLEHLRRRLNSVARDRGVRLEVSTNARHPLSNRDANVAMLILENLVMNALQASESGRRVTITARQPAEALEFRVRDEGGGVPTAVQARLFQPANSTKPGGSGLGLALSRQLARGIGAELELATTGSTGSEFILRLAPSFTASSTDRG